MSYMLRVTPFTCGDAHADLAHVRSPWGDSSRGAQAHAPNMHYSIFSLSQDGSLVFRSRFGRSTSRHGVVAMCVRAGVRRLPAGFARGFAISFRKCLPYR